MRISIEVLKEIEQKQAKFLHFIFCAKLNVLVTRVEFEECGGPDECKGYCPVQVEEYFHG